MTKPATIPDSNEVFERGTASAIERIERVLERLENRITANELAIANGRATNWGTIASFLGVGVLIAAALGGMFIAPLQSDGAQAVRRFDRIEQHLAEKFVDLDAKDTHSNEDRVRLAEDLKEIETQFRGMKTEMVLRDEAEEIRRDLAIERATHRGNQ